MHVVLGLCGHQPMKIPWPQLWRNSCDFSQALGLSQPRVLEVVHDYQLHPQGHSRDIRFQVIILYGSILANGYDINTLRMDFLYEHNILLQTKNGLSARTCSTSTTATAWHGIILMRSAKDQVRFSVSVSAGFVGDLVVGLYLLPDRLTDKRCSDILWIILPGMHDVVPLSVRQWRFQGRMHELGRRIQLQWIFSVGTPEGVYLCSHSDYQRSRDETSSRCDSGRCQHVKACSRECRVAYCRLIWNEWEAGSDTHCN
jgi:hypothetical protein